jgi:hypothetical protein
VDPELLLLLPPSTLPLPREPSDGGGTVVDPELLLLLPSPVLVLPSTSPLPREPSGGGAVVQSEPELELELLELSEPLDWVDDNERPELSLLMPRQSLPVVDPLLELLEEVPKLDPLL